MKKYHFSILVFTMLWLAIFLSSSGAAEFKVTRVYDGDTVKAETPDIVIYIMLVGIDAPEVPTSSSDEGQPFGMAAKEYLSSLVLNKTVVVEGYGTVPYPDNNIISVLYIKGKNVNLEMVKQGFAEVHRNNLPLDFGIEPYLAAEKDARETKRGMWIQGDDYMSPSQWRKMHKRP